MTIRGTDYVLRVRVACQCIQREKSLSHPKLAPHFSRLLEFLMSKRSRDAYAAPTVLKPFQKKNPDLVQVVIETPKGSRNKYEFDPKLRTFTLSKVLPSGMVFPHDFGFIPSTEADDGDPVDVLILMDEPAFFFFSSRRRHTRDIGDWSSDVCSSDLAHLQRLSLRFHDHQRTGDLTTRLTSDTQAIQEMIANGITVLGTNGFLLAGMLVVMFWLNWQIGRASCRERV